MVLLGKNMPKARECVLSRFSRVRLFVTLLGPELSRLLRPCDSPAENAAVGGHALLQAIVPTQESNPLPFQFLPWQAGRFFTSSTTYWRKICQKVQFSRSVLSNSLWPHSSTPGFPDHHQLPELVQPRVHRVGEAKQYVESNRTKVVLPVLTHHTHSFAL